jgi:hypothetical protein
MKSNLSLLCCLCRAPVTWETEKIRTQSPREYWRWINVLHGHVLVAHGRVFGTDFIHIMPVYLSSCGAATYRVILAHAGCSLLSWRGGGGALV